EEILIMAGFKVYSRLCSFILIVGLVIFSVVLSGIIGFIVQSWQWFFYSLLSLSMFWVVMIIWANWETLKILYDTRDYHCKQKRCL
ncbi:hypothetical protein KKG48_02155, partial [Patescibacteria group bacterium]|nr:hypothetical protein [Patescibacteria group bacterium]